ncbi:hypothetical protein [Parageobacillus toebii]|uniref:hypothetical protein n=1 Tax=Parageobacillus toebii TaxID=153151 RepID=UPI002E1AF21D|nr:hypothetical protein [Parageobacillus toebii]
MNSRKEKSKSERHKDIAGKFGEYFVLYYLSKNNFECVKFDYVGIDLFAQHNEDESEKWGISVKLFNTQNQTKGILKNTITKAESSCKKFGWKPYIAMVFDRENEIDIFLCPTYVLREDGFLHMSKTKYRWSFREEYWKKYKKHKDVHFLSFKLDKIKWFSPNTPNGN